MNHFKKSLQVTATKRIDEKISANIEEELRRLELEVHPREYKEQIEQRKKGLRNIFISFEHNMEIIEENNKYGVVYHSEEGQSDYERYLDKTIQKRIWQRLEKLYQYTMHYLCQYPWLRLDNQHYCQ